MRSESIGPPLTSQFMKLAIAVQLKTALSPIETFTDCGELMILACMLEVAAYSIEEQVKLTC